MAKEKFCKNCKIVVQGENCPICKKDQLTTNNQGIIYVTNLNKSLIAQKMNITMNGKYAIKVK